MCVFKGMIGVTVLVRSMHGTPALIQSDLAMGGSPDGSVPPRGIKAVSGAAHLLLLLLALKPPLATIRHLKVLVHVSCEGVAHERSGHGR